MAGAIGGDAIRSYLRLGVPMSLLDVSRSILVLIDFQGKLVHMVHRPALVLESARRLMRLADLFSVPVVLTEQYPKGIGPTEESIRKVFDGLTTPTFFLEKTAFGCCGDSGFEGLLQKARPVLRPPPTPDRGGGYRGPCLCHANRARAAGLRT